MESIAEVLPRAYMPQEAYPLSGKFEDPNVIIPIALELATNTGWGVIQACQSAEDKQLVAHCIDLLNRPNVVRSEWAELKAQALLSVGSNVADAVCHIASAARTPSVGESALRSAAVSLMKANQEKVKATTENAIRQLFKNA